MIKIDPSILIIAGEVMLALLLALIAMLFFMLKNRKSDRAAAAELKGRLKNGVAARQELFEGILADSIENGDADANRELAMSWVEKEKQFYAHVVKMYMGRNAEMLRGFDKTVHEYSASYLELVSLMRTRLEDERDSIPDEVKEQLERLTQENERLAGVVQTLEQENQRLSGELEGANREIDQAMKEYSVAFRPGSGMTGSAAVLAPAAPLVMAATAPDASGAVAVETPAAESAPPEPAAELAEPDEPTSEEIGAELDELSAAIMAESDDLAASTEPEPVEEMDLAAFDEMPESGPEPEPETTVAEVGLFDNLDETPDADSAVDDEAAKGPVIDLADEGDIVLPQLNELMSAIELPDSSEEEMMGDLLGEEEIPILEESLEVDVSDEVDEEKLLAQLEGLEALDEGELPTLSDEGMLVDEMADLDELLPKRDKDAPAKS